MHKRFFLLPSITYMAELSDIITSKVRVKIIELLWSNVTEIYHVREIVRRVGEEINAVRRELKNLEDGGLLKKEQRGNRLYYWARPEYPFFGEILAIIAKTTGLGKEIIVNKSKLGKILFVMFSGRFVRRKPRKHDDDVDILVVGEVVLAELAQLIRKEESKRSQEINYTVMGRDEFDFRKKRRDPFLQGILLGSRVMIIGDEEDLVG
ncbi:MAG: winged helix-turn-helix domain-containing protein [Patescibacteria group bacterium]|nr:winged helix-turn-helix domain-containing protein [Patescibacteria group bacterium]